MELHDFVRETLVQVIKGVVDAQNSDVVKNSNAAVAPAGQGTLDKASLNQVIEFDVAVTAKEDKQTKGEASVSITLIKLNTQGASGKSNEAINKIKFKIPIFLPGQKINKK